MDMAIHYAKKNMLTRGTAREYLFAMTRDYRYIDDVLMVEDLENKVAIAQAIIDRCLRLSDTIGERDAPRSVTWDMIIAELRALREGVLK